LADYKHLLLKLPGARSLAGLQTEFESRWFDWKHNVSTAGDVHPVEKQVVGANAQHGIHYNPTGLRAGKRMIDELPISDFSQYTFIDYGSGKGRMLLLASEHPFRRIIGVEYSRELHAIAEKNIRSYRNSRQKCHDVTSVNMDAAQFDVPLENAVLYFYFPFRRPVMEPLIRRLDESVGAHPRDIFIVYLNPELSDVVDQARNFQLMVRRQYYALYRTRS
jgi:hypothetical protein